ncbi:phage tail protein [Escherichia coli]|nr:phage tail protein [Escherichia coli]EGO4965904.1 phage tail protein [Escherichia coli]EHC2516191.1 phage tail protein [Escherichia coli]
MATKYFALLTNIGAAKLANATALGAQVEITKMAVGDGNGALPTPNPAQTALTHELRRAQLNMLTIDPVNTNQIIAEQVIPEDVGGWWIREIGLFDKDGDMIAVANCAETYKPQLQEGSGRVQVIRVILIVSSTEAVTLKIDPSVVLATRKYVDDAVIEVKAYADDVMKKHVAAANPHKQYPLIANALKEMVDAGLVNQILENLGLGEAAKRDVGTGENQIPDMNAWSHSGPATGRWRKSPDGLIEQWGSAGISDAYGNAAVTFPIAFSSEPDFVLFGPRNVTAPTRMTSIVLDESQLRNTGFTCRCFDHLDGSTTPSTSNFYWYCRGY